MSNKGESLSAYYQALHDEALNLAKFKNSFSVVVVAALVAAIYAKGYWLYAAALSALLFQVLVWFFSYKSAGSSALALDFQKMSMLYDAYGTVVSDFDLSHLQSRVSLRVSSRVFKILAERQEGQANNTYRIINDSSPELRLISMIQENAFWNHHLYSYSYKTLELRLLVASLLVGAFSLFLIPVITSDPDYSLPRLAFTVLSFAIIYEQVERALNYKTASAGMLELDNEISRLYGDPGTQVVLRLFSKYNSIQDMRLSIPDSIYRENRDRLNNAWDQRVAARSSG